MITYKSERNCATARRTSKYRAIKCVYRRCSSMAAATCFQNGGPAAKAKK